MYRTLCGGFFMQESGGALKKGIKEVAKATLITLIFSLVGVLVLALLVRTNVLSDGAIKLTNQFVKVLAIFVGCYASLRGEKGLIKGAVSGIFGILVTFFVFALISGSITAGFSLVWDILFGVFIGAVGGIVAVNLKKD